MDFNINKELNPAMRFNLFMSNPAIKRISASIGARANGFQKDILYAFRIKKTFKTWKLRKNNKGREAEIAKITAVQRKSLQRIKKSEIVNKLLPVS